MTARHFSVADVLAHAPPMILLDEIIDCDDTTLRAAVSIREGTLFREAQGVPGYVGLEYMAQACGAYVGVLARAAGAPVRVGYLLGTRQYKIHVPYFALGDRLIVSASIVYRDEEMGSFDCRIDIGGICAGEARLNVYQPREGAVP